MAKNNFTINLIPTPCPRPRVTKRGHTYYPKKYSDFKADLRRELDKLELEIVEGAIRLEAIFYMPIPMSLSKVKREEIVDQWHIKRPDTDNLMKGLKDGMEGICYNDDSQVSYEIGKKIYSNEPRIVVNYSSINNPQFHKKDHYDLK